MNENMVMIIVMPTMFVVSAWAFKTLLNFVQQRQLTKLHYALQDRLLEKLGSSPQAIEYLHSDAGEKMFALATKERTNPYTRILSALQAGAVITLLGVGFLFLRTMVTDEARDAFAVIGVLGLSLGLGFLASSAAAYVFSKSWGLINGAREDNA
jgi:hypothetical protein